MRVVLGALKDVAVVKGRILNLMKLKLVIIRRSIQGLEISVMKKGILRINVERLLDIGLVNEGE